MRYQAAFKSRVSAAMCVSVDMYCLTFMFSIFVCYLVVLREEFLAGLPILLVCIYTRTYVGCACDCFTTHHHLRSWFIELLVVGRYRARDVVLQIHDDDV